MVSIRLLMDNALEAAFSKGQIPCLSVSIRLLMDNALEVYIPAYYSKLKGCFNPTFNG